MYQYTTPTLPITITDLDFSEVDFFRIKIVKGDKSFLFVVGADDENVYPEAHKIMISLTQEQTAELETGFGEVQARIKYLNGNVQATNKATVTIEDVLDKVVI